MTSHKKSEEKSGHEQEKNKGSKQMVGTKNTKDMKKSNTVRIQTENSSQKFQFKE